MSRVIGAILEWRTTHPIRNQYAPNKGRSNHVGISESCAEQGYEQT